MDHKGSLSSCSHYLQESASEQFVGEEMCLQLIPDQSSSLYCCLLLCRGLKSCIVFLL